jgi:hypothetical protein
MTAKGGAAIGFSRRHYQGVSNGATIETQQHKQ